MTRSHGSYPRQPKPKSASPAERGAEFAETQRRLKREAAERRLKAVDRPDARPSGRTTAGKSRGRG
jgi:hypothetical protein